MNEQCGRCSIKGDPAGPDTAISWGAPELKTLRCPPISEARASLHLPFSPRSLPLTAETVVSAPVTQLRCGGFLRPLALEVAFRFFCTFLTLGLFLLHSQQPQSTAKDSRGHTPPSPERPGPLGAVWRPCCLGNWGGA